jgi:sulfonate transport system ATP-binding protein
MISQEAAVTPHRTREGISVLAEDVVRRFGDRAVLDHLWLEIAASEFVVLLGPAGCGKTTLLRLLGGFDPPDAGTVSVPASRAIVFQGPRLLSWERVWQNVTIGLYGHEAKPTALSVPDEVRLSERAQSVTAASASCVFVASTSTSSGVRSTSAGSPTAGRPR